MLKNFEWLYPNADHTPENLDIFDKITMDAMTVTNAELAQVMEMQLSTLQDPPTELGSHFYLRSWAMTGEQLQILLDYLARNELRFEETDAWRKVLHLHHHGHVSAPTHYTLRYMGMEEGPRRPIDRYYEDLDKRRSGILIEVIRALEECLPEVTAAVEVHSLPSAYLQPESHLYADDVERVLIEFFHHPTLINRQRGGFYSSYVPSSDDADVFKAMKTNF